MRDFTNTYDAFMHCDVNKLAEAFASMYHSEGEECDRLGCAKQEVNEAFMRMKTITPKVETNQSILLVCKDFGDTGDDVSLIKAIGYFTALESPSSRFQFTDILYNKFIFKSFV